MPLSSSVVCDSPNALNETLLLLFIEMSSTEHKGLSRAGEIVVQLCENALQQTDFFFTTGILNATSTNPNEIPLNKLLTRLNKFYWVGKSKC